MKISILLPYKENFSPSYAGAVSIFINDTMKISQFRKNIIVYGNTSEKKKFNKNYINLNYKKSIIKVQQNHISMNFSRKKKINQM